MARIRSIHPSLFTDEAWVSCSPLARLLYIGLWTDADDQGLFEWKPLQIRMRLLPGDSADVPSLLQELVDANLIAGLESGGKKLGAIRYFRRFQRPKKPNATFLLPVEWRTYVGLDTDGSEVDSAEQDQVPNQFPTSAEKSPQMEDGGWRREEVPSVSNETGAAAPLSASPQFEGKDPKAKAWAVAKHLLSERGGLTAARAGEVVGKLVRDHSLDADELIAISDACWGTRSEAPVPYLTKAATEIASRRRAPGGVIDAPSERQQISWMEDLRENEFSWRPERGPRPGQAGCRVSAEIQRRYGFEPAPALAGAAA